MVAHEKPYHVCPVPLNILSFSAGVCGALVLAIALVAVGWFIKVANLQLRGATDMLVVSIVGFILNIGGMMPWSCEHAQLGCGCLQ